MRQFILTIGTLAAVLASCWQIYQGIAAIITNRLDDSFFHLLIAAPIMMSLAIAFDYVNSLLHEDYRRFRKSIVRKKGVQQDILHPHSKEVRDTPWEDDSSHTQ